MIMSKYTTELRYPVTQRLKDMGLSADESNWPEAYGFIGLGDYPIYDESHRQVLNDKIMRRYWFREIGFETWGQFVWHVRTHMHEVMPYYNDLYETVGLITDPLSSRDMSYDETWTRNESEDSTRERTEKTTTDSTSTANQSSTSNDKNVFQDTPMNGLDTGAIENMDYATNVTFDTGSTESDSSSTSKSGRDVAQSDRDGRTGDFEGSKSHRERGFDRPQAETLLTYRKAIINIDLEVVESLADLFMGLW